MKAMNRGHLFLVPFLLFPSPPEDSAQELNRHGVEMLEYFDFVGAAKQFRSALEAQPESDVIRVNLGLASYYLGSFQESKDELEKVLSSHPDDPCAHFVLGLVGLRQASLDVARDHFVRVLEQDPDDWGALFRLGLIRQRNEDYTAAIDFYERALEQKPDEPSVLYNLSRALVLNGDTEEGMKTVKRFKEVEKKMERPVISGMGQPNLATEKYAQPRQLGSSP
jgi:tetratricopeptide (TPR) repeat protein